MLAGNDAAAGDFIDGAMSSASSEDQRDCLLRIQKALEDFEFEEASQLLQQGVANNYFH
jgi:hypothetical protein